MKRGVLIWSESGGIGKTTLSTNLCAALARKGESVLAIDLDPQVGGLTNHLGLTEYYEMEREMILHAMLDPDNSDVREQIVEAGGFDVIPSSAGLSNADRAIQKDRMMRELHSKQYNHSTGMGDDNEPEIPYIARLQAVLQPVIHEYDYIIIDAQASYSVLIDNAIVATREIMIPMEPNEKGIQTVKSFGETIDRLEKQYSDMFQNFSLNTLAMIPNEKEDSTIHNKVLRQLIDEGYPVTPFAIRCRNQLQYAWGENMHIYDYTEENDLWEKNSDIIQWFDQLAEIVKRGYIDREEDRVGKFVEERWLS